MAKPIKNLTNMEIDEISLVDKGANQHAMITIAKRAPEEDDMPEFDLYAEDGSSVAEDDLKHGDIVYDAEGNPYQYTEDDEETVEDEVEEKEPQLVGKSAFFEPKHDEASFTKQVLDELSKAFNDDDRDKVIAKALGKVAELEAQQAEYVSIAKAERDLRLTREYISKAAEYNLPVDAEELGPVLYRMAETMSYEDCAVIAKCLETAGEIIFEETGYTGGGDNADIYSQVEQHAYDTFGKSEDFNAVSAVNTVFDQNPDAYDEYLAAQRNR
jgi:hypothetical protein